MKKITAVKQSIRMQIVAAAILLTAVLVISYYLNSLANFSFFTASDLANVHIGSEEYIIILNKDSSAKIEDIEKQTVQFGLKTTLIVRPNILIVKTAPDSNPGWLDQIKPQVLKATAAKLEAEEVESVLGQGFSWAVEFWNNSRPGVKMAIAEATSTPAEEDFSDIVYEPTRPDLPEKARCVDSPSYQCFGFDYPQKEGTIALRRRIVIAVIFIESNGAIDENKEDWNEDMINKIRGKVLEEFNNFANNADPYAQLSFDIWFMQAETDYEPIKHASDAIYGGYIYSNIWDHLSGHLTGDLEWLNDTTDRAEKFIFDAIKRSNADEGFIIHMINNKNDFDNCFEDICASFAALGGPEEFLLYSHVKNMPYTILHETGHIFHAYDEYRGCRDSPEQGCNAEWNNCDNSNCVDCPGTAQTCIMRTAITRNVCDQTRCHIGWICWSDVSDSPFASDIITLHPGETYVSRICPSYDMDWYKIEVPLTEEFNLHLSSPNSDYYMALYDSNGAFVQEDTTSSEEKNIRAILEPGIYNIKVYGALEQDWDNNAEYQISVNLACSEPGCDLPAECN